MTKLEYLRSLEAKGSFVEALYTWKAQGGLFAESTTKIYNQNSIYVVRDSSSKMDGFMVFCNKDCSGNQFSWSNAAYYDSAFGEITFGNDIVCPYFTVVLTKDEYLEASGSYDPSAYDQFQPYKDLNKSNEVIISDDDYGLCLKPVGYPFITEEELEYTREEITKMAIKPALEEYFHWIPNTRPTETEATSSEMLVPMPSDAYCVVGLSLQQYGSNVSGNILSPLFYGVEQSLYGSYNFSTMTGTYTGSTPFTNTNTMTSLLSGRQAAQAMINLNRRVHYEGPYTIDTKALADQLKSSIGGKYIKVYANDNGIFNVWWGIQTLDFNDVEFAERTRVIEYAQACVKELFGSIRSLARTEIPGQIDYSRWATEAATTKEKIRDAWRHMVKFSGVMRGSLG